MYHMHSTGTVSKKGADLVFTRSQPVRLVKGEVTMFYAQSTGTVKKRGRQLVIYAQSTTTVRKKGRQGMEDNFSLTLLTALVVS